MSEQANDSVPAPAPSSTVNPRLLLGAIALGTFLVFLRTVGNDFINVDDPQYLIDNPHVNQGITLSGLWWALTTINYFYWQPLTWLSHMIDCAIYGLNPAGHHLTSVLLHSANAALAYYALWKLTGKQWASVLAALIFAWHPLRVESVAWSAERKDVLSVFFFFWTIIFYERWAHHADRGSYWRAVITMLCALASKPSVVTIPLVLLLLDYWPLQRREGIVALVKEKWPFLALSAMSMMTTVIGQRQLGAVVPIQALAAEDRLSNGLLSYTRYIGKIIFPINLAVYYPYEVGIPMGIVAVSAIFVLIVTAAFFFMRKRRPYLLTGWLWYLVTLLPMLGLVQSGAQARADRFTYVPMFGLVVMVVWLVTSWTQSKILLVVPLVLGYLTFDQIALWKNSVILFTHTLQVTPVNPFALTALGAAQTKKGDTAGALQVLEEAARVQPDFVLARSNLANAYLRSGMPEKAAAEFQEAMRLDPRRADYVLMAGTAKMEAKQPADAVPLFEKALAMGLPASLTAEAHNNLGLIAAQSGNTDRALEQFQTAARTDPTLIAAHKNVVSIYMRQQKHGMAVSYLEGVTLKLPQQAELRQMLQALRETGPIK